MKKLSLLCATTALVMPAMAFAQSTGSQDFEEETIVITGARTQEVGGVTAPDTTKAKAALTSEVIARQNPGQTILDTINLIPGVSFQNNDAYGSSGGTLNIRGFAADRISLTLDGVPLNDSGNYAIFSNQQVDPEVIGEVNVNLGTTDVDSPTASAAGGTVNYRTIVPRKEMGALVSASIGEYDFHRLFGMIETGSFTPWDTRAFVSASYAKNDNPFNQYGKVYKQQYNAKIYQPIGTAGDFVALAGHYNQNRNNFFGSSPLRWDTTRVIGTGAAARTAPRIVGGQANNRFPMNNDEREYLVNYPCNVAPARAGLADVAAPTSDPRAGLIFSPDLDANYASCGTEFDRRYNPSNTGNIRLASRFTFGKFTLTVDPSYQYVKANGGGTILAQEGLRDINPAQPPDPDGAGPLPRPPATATPQECRTAPNNAFNTCVAGYLGGNPFFGRDINGDGDTLDAVNVLAPSQTQTHRFGLIAGLRYDINDDHSIRAGYTLDHARHRQTGQVGLLDIGGEPLDVFPVNDPQADVNGVDLQKRDRLSYAILHQFWAEYRGQFMDNKLTVNLGLRAPFFKRDLNNFCSASSPTFVECFGRGDPRYTTFATLNPQFQGPQQRVFKYNKLLPNIGLTFDIMPRTSIFANYAKGLSVPSTDNLYNAFFFAPNTAAASPKPESTDNFDTGLRYRSPKIQAQLGAFFNRYSNRTASAFDPELNVSTFRNLGKVDKYGLDGYVSYQAMKQLNIYLFGSVLKSEIKDDLIIAECNAAQVAAQFPGCTAVDVPILAATAGKRESGAAKYTFGGTVRGNVGPFELGITAKRTGPRYVFDTNEPVHAFIGNPSTDTIVFPASTPAYWLVNLDARVSLADYGLEKSYLQFNVYNLFDQFYVGGFGGSLNQTITRANNGTITAYSAPPFVQIGAPRTISATLVMGF
ncbi:MAG: iron complex outerrane recepter protein [Sphingomonadales bacterium]|jgi:iron complex outermembrane receptor protein|nr:iron complex outerrane recepter protein [Sphingomonadales bacterium]